jgi:hypothetical protein
MSSLFENTTVMNLLRRVSQFETREVWRSIFSETEFQQFVLDLIRIHQLFEKGIDETGDVIGYYSWTTENMYNPEKVEGTPYTLKDTGAFYRSMEATLGDLELTIDADPLKTDKTGKRTNLFEKYGEGIIGLADESKEKLREEVLEKCYEQVRRLLQWH